MNGEMRAVEAINKRDVFSKMNATLNLCDMYHQTDEGLTTIYNEWSRNKGGEAVWDGMSVLDILSKHPDYVPEKGYIVKKAEYDRSIDFPVINEILGDIRDSAAPYLLRKVELKPFSYSEIFASVQKYMNLADSFASFPDMRKVTYNGMTYDEVKDEYLRWVRKLDAIKKEYDVEYGIVYTKESYAKYVNFRSLMREFVLWIRSKKEEADASEEPCMQLLIDKKVVKFIEESNLNFKGIREGQTFNKVMGKILTQMGFRETWRSFNQQTARLGDAANPMRYTRFTIISANPVDYWRMSFGSSWCSCHTIDKLKRFAPSRGGQSYDGMHGSGTESYMLDSPTIIMYTVDKDYEGSDYELEPKINRCMFHIGQGKFIMGRVYPQGKDGEKDVYRQWRNIFQTVISECLGIPNYWRTEYDLTSKREQRTTTGTHYPDYDMEYCNIAGWSWYKPFADSVPSTTKIKIGHYPICPSCGEEHDIENNIECERCSDEYNDYIEHCHCCGARIDTERDCYETDGDGWYWCDCDCAARDGFRYAVDEEDGYLRNENDLYYEDCSGDWYRDYYGYGVTTDDGWYHDSYTAEENGWRCYEGEWYAEGDFEDDAYTGEEFPYWYNTSEYYEHDGNYFMTEENMEAWIADNTEEETEVA